MRLGEYPVAHALVQRRGDDRGSNCRAETSGNPVSRSSSSPASSSRPRLALCEQDDNRLGGKPPRHERQHLRR